MAAALVMALAAPAADAHVVSNPQSGTLGATLSSLALTIGSQVNSLPAGGTFASGGTVDQDGNLTIPAISPLSVPLPTLPSVPNLLGFAISSTGGTLAITSATPLTGTINPSTGAATLVGTLSLVEHIPLTIVTDPILHTTVAGTLNCAFGSVPIALSTANAGGSPYDQATGALTLTEGALPIGAPLCTSSDLGALVSSVTGPVLSALGLPSTPSLGQLNLGLLLSPILNAGPIAVLTAVPPIGTVPLATVLDASASLVPAGVKQYDWDTNGDGITDVTTFPPTATLPLTVPTPGVLTAAVRVVDLNGDSDRALTLITGLLGIVTGGGGSGGTGGGTTGGTTGGGTSGGGSGGGGGSTGSAASALDATRIVSLPSAKRCVSRRRLRITLHAPAGTSLRSATVRIGKGRARRLTGRSLTGAPVSLMGLPSGRYVVTVTVTTADDRTATLRRTYRTCAPRRH